jgi:hypothetical protein
VANDADQAVSTSRIACASASRVSGAGGAAWLQPARMTARASAAGKEYRFYMVPSHGPSSISQRSYVRLQGIGTGHWNTVVEEMSPSARRSRTGCRILGNWPQTALREVSDTLSGRCIQEHFRRPRMVAGGVRLLGLAGSVVGDHGRRWVTFGFYRPAPAGTDCGW